MMKTFRVAAILLALSTFAGCSSRGHTIGLKPAAQAAPTTAVTDVSTTSAPAAQAAAASAPARQAATAASPSQATTNDVNGALASVDQALQQVDAALSSVDDSRSKSDG